MLATCSGVCWVGLCCSGRDSEPARLLAVEPNSIASQPRSGVQLHFETSDISINLFLLGK